MENQKIIENSLLKILSLNGFPDASKMTQRDFEHISIDIESKTGVMLSSTTIKRLSNGEFSRLPQVATLNAIAKYFGFTNWQEYKVSAASANKTLTFNTEAAHVVSLKRKLPRFALVLLVVPVLAIVFFISKEKENFGNLDEVVFTAKKNVDNQIPNTVVFTYNVDKVDADSFFIQQSWDDNRRVRIFKNHYTLTDIYYEPGYHIAKLIANSSMIKEIEVSIPTDRWFIYANENKIKYKTEYINVENLISNGILGISKETLVQNNIDTRENLSYIYAYFPSKQEVSGDNFVLKSRIRMKEVKHNLCPFIEFEVFCQRYYMIIKSTEKGCASEALVQFGNKVLDGKGTDLGSIAFDVWEWNDIELFTKNKHVTVKINGKVAFETAYEHSTKNIAGLAFISNGLCEVDYVDVTGNSGVVVYKNDFDD